MEFVVMVVMCGVAEASAAAGVAEAVASDVVALDSYPWVGHGDADGRTGIGADVSNLSKETRTVT